MIHDSPLPWACDSDIWENLNNLFIFILIILGYILAWVMTNYNSEGQGIREINLILSELERYGLCGYFDKKL